MSNEVAVVPDYLKAMMAEGTVVDTTSTMLVSGGVARLTTKGKTFRFKEGEDEVKAGQEIHLVIVGMHPVIGLSHTWYKEKYNPDSSAPPDCSSMDGVRPDSWISQPVNPNCAQCPNQSWGSAVSMSGGKAKACRDSKQLYVARAEDFSKDPDNCTLYLLQVTVNSLRAFSNYGKLLGTKGFPGPQFVITKVFFDDEASVPKLEFELIGPLNEENGMASHKRNEKSEWSSTANSNLIAHDNGGSGPDKRSIPVVNHDTPPVEAYTEQANLEPNGSLDNLIEQW